ncbi:MAG: hypothetical protein PUF48_01475 [Oscillospiraceae bacterium]|nr:hypothetical protein [Oscillospiraceae bacterium]
MCNYNNNVSTSCCSCRTSRCLLFVFAIIGALFLATLGLILGAVFAESILAALAAFIVLAIVLLIIALISVFVAICRRSR